MPATPARRLRDTLALTAALLVLFNLLAALFLDRHTSNLGYFVVREKWKLLLGLERPVDWLILGDSSGNQAVRPDLFETGMGVKALNLCTVGGGTLVNDAWMLESYVRRLGPPKRVVLVHVYDVWHRRPNSLVFAQIPLGGAQLARLSPDPGFTGKEQAYFALSRYLPLYFENTSLADAAMYPWKAGQTSSLSADGFMEVLEAAPERVVADQARHLEFVRAHPFEVSPTNRAALERILALADQHQFDVVFVHSPIYDGLYAEKDFRAYFDRADQMLAELAAAHPRFHVLLEAPQTFPKEQMENTDHVVR